MLISLRSHLQGLIAVIDMHVLPKLLLVLPLVVLSGCSALDTPSQSVYSKIARDPDQWVSRRLEAVSNLYNITPEGRHVLASLDVRQMRGQPGFFASYGFHGWTGLGEAKPTGVIHELGHAYWGAFPVTGFPSLSWDAPAGQVSSAKQRYWDDAVTFLTQPPDPYEVFRQRLKNLPELSSQNLDPLFHTVEADMVSMVGGDLALVPPILRKYWDRFLPSGLYSQWDDAITWYLGLPQRERSLADRYLGFQHLDLRQYRSLKPPEPSSMNEVAEEILQQEELQRLWDFAQQFDLLIQNPEESENFKFWRGYLRDINNIHKEHSGFLADSGLPDAPEIAHAFDFLKEIDGLSPQEKARRLAQELQNDPFVAHFLPVLDNKTLLELFTSGASLPSQATLKGTATFVDQLKGFVPVVDHVLAAGEGDPEDGAAELRRFLPSLDLHDREETDLFFEILVDTGGRVSKEVAVALDKETQRRLLEATPALLRRLLDPGDMAGALDITDQATPQQISEGITLMIKHPSGNFRIDEPFLDEVYRVMTRRGEREPRQMLQVITSSPFPIERFIYQHPLTVVAILSSDLEVTMKLVKESDPVTLPPARFVYGLIFADPAFAARVVERLDSDGEDQLVLESLAHLAYDKARVEANPDLPISLSKDGLFLQTLLEDKGPSWLEGKLRVAAELYRGRVQASEVSSDFLEAYRSTLEAAAQTMPKDVQTTLLSVIGAAFER